MNTLEIKIRPEPKYGVEGLKRIDYMSCEDGKPDWALVLPPKSGRLWVVVIHGHGSHGDQLYTRADIRDSWLPHVMNKGFGIFTPNLRDNAWMSPEAASDLQSLLDWLRANENAERFIFASGSMGGTSNLIYAVLHPKDVAGVIALCPATDLATYYKWCVNQPLDITAEIAAAIRASYKGTPDDLPETYEKRSACGNSSHLTMPTFIAHGTADRTIPVTQSQRLADLMSKKSGFRYVEMPDGGHDAPLETFNSALDWTLSKI